MIFAGPLNVAGWFFGWPQDDNIFISDVTTMVFIVLMPATVVATTILIKMRKRPTIPMAGVVGAAFIGLLLAALSGPLFLGLSEIYAAPNAVDGPKGVSEFFAAVFGMTFLGLLFGIVPFFTVTVGLPCMIVAVAVAHLCTELVYVPSQHNPSQTP